MIKFPSKSDVAPLFVPFKITFTNGSGSLVLASNTLPEIINESYLTLILDSETLNK